MSQEIILFDVSCDMVVHVYIYFFSIGKNPLKVELLTYCLDCVTCISIWEYSCYGQLRSTDDDDGDITPGLGNVRTSVVR